ncbi:MAG: CDP-glycerol glycerophosphotransferase family protein [Steroidobacteraceae bacterium]
MYAPTWSPASSLNLLGVDLIERLLARPVNLVVKLHDRSRDLRPQYSGGVDWVARLSPMLRRPHARLALHGNIIPCLAAADAMITDHSSCGFEYMLLDRPIVRIEIPELLKQANVHPDYVSLLADAALNARDAEGTANAVDRALRDPHERTATRRAAAETLFYKAGGATARCAGALYEVLGLVPRASAVGETQPCLQSA